MVHQVARCSMMTHTGHVRADNEDTIAVSAVDEQPLVRWTGDLPLHEGWALVADGMGGHAAGDVASQIAVELLRPVMSSLTNAQEIALALNAANDGLFDTMERHPEFEGMGTTIAGVILRGDHALAFNVGDSRIYLHHEGNLNQVSTDDVVGGSMLTQCLGGFSRPAGIVPHVREVRMPPGTTLMLCSDGLTDMVTDACIASILSTTGGSNAASLVAAALTAGGSDNVSAAVIIVPT